MAGAEGQVMVRRVLRRHGRTVALVVAMLIGGASK
jgi:hypothetical protein